MNLSELLNQRHELLQRTQLANLAFAYARLDEFADRMHRAGFRGIAELRNGDAGEGVPWATLSGAALSPAVVEEHFTEEDLIELADVLAYAGHTDRVELSFRVDDFRARFVAPLREQLEALGVAV